MTESEFNQNAGQSREHNRDHECPALIDLAAYLDGTIAGTQAAAIGAHLTACDICRSAAEDVRLAKSQGDAALTFVPQHVLEAAMALVPSQRHISHTTRGRLLRQSLAAAAAIGICVGGYQVGFSMSSPGESGASLDSEMTFGLLDDAAAVDDEFFAFSQLEQS